MDSRKVLLREVAVSTKDSIAPQDGVEYWHYSLPSFDAGRKPVKEDGSDIRSSKLLVRKGDILCNKLNMRFRRVWRVNEELPNSVCSTEFIPLQAKAVNRDYLYYVLISDDFTNKMTSMRSGTSGSHQRVKPEQLLSYEFELPDESNQERIAGVLSSIDSKIAVNQRINDYLEELVSARFAAAFGSNRPTTKLENVLRISTRSAKPQDHPNEIWEHYSIPAFDESHRPVMEFASNIKSNKYIVGKSSILISKLNPSVKRFWLPACLTKHSVCSTEFIVYEPIAPNRKSFYAAAISSDTFQNYLLAHVTGSTGSRQRAQPKSTLDYPMPNPGKAEIEDFCLFADPIYAQIEENEHESASLTQLRDTLLPKLMSGEIDVIKTDLTQLNNHLSDCSRLSSLAMSS